MADGYSNQDIASEATVAKRFAGGKTTRAFTKSSSGDNTVLTPTSGKKLRVYWVGMSTSEGNTAEVLVAVKIGSTEFYKWYLGAPGAFSKWEPLEGAINDSFIINLSAAQTVQVNVTYEEI